MTNLKKRVEGLLAASEEAMDEIGVHYQQVKIIREALMLALNDDDIVLMQSLEIKLRILLIRSGVKDIEKKEIGFKPNPQ